MGLKKLRSLSYLWILLSILVGYCSSEGDIWPLERPDGMAAIQSLEVMCGKDHMDVHLSFTQPFEGIVSSKGQWADPRCIYVPPSTGKTFFSFRIAYARCGTKPDLNGQFYENTVVVQYDKDLLEVWDEAKRLRCEWYNDYEKTASKPPMVIADLDVIQLDFRGDNVDCWMEIQQGKGPWAPPVSGIVPLGSTLTLVVAINDNRGEFDMRVKSCAASDGAGHIIQLTDEHGCVLRPKMISRFLKARISDERASVITYAFFHAFKFPDALSVHIKCKVEICRHGCLDHCQVGGHPPGLGGPGPLPHGFPQERKDSDMAHQDLIYDETQDAAETSAAVGPGANPGGTAGPELAAAVSPQQGMPRNPQTAASSPQSSAQQQTPRQPASPPPVHEDVDDVPFPQDDRERFPHGPRKLELGASVVARKRRSVVVSDRRVRSADVGVSGLYDVVSQADLAFSLDSKQEPVTVFQGRITEEVVYGICLPAQGFSALFVLAAVSAAAAALVAGALLYRYRVSVQAQALRSRSAAAPTMWLSFLRPHALRVAPQPPVDSNR